MYMWSIDYLASLFQLHNWIGACFLVHPDLSGHCLPSHGLKNHFWGRGTHVTHSCVDIMRMMTGRGDIQLKMGRVQSLVEVKISVGEFRILIMRACFGTPKIIRAPWSAEINWHRMRWEDRLCGLVVRVPGYRSEIYCVSCEVRTKFIYVM
jgi:hypothetical protein